MHLSSLIFDLQFSVSHVKRFCKLYVAVAVLQMLVPHTIAQSAVKPIRFDFRAVSVAQVIQLIYSEVLTSAYVIDPDVLGDGRVVSFRYTNDKGDIRLFVHSFIDSLGYSTTSCRIPDDWKV